jgi:hypothetical protein
MMPNKPLHQTAVWYNRPLQQTAAALRPFEIQRFTSRRGR